MRDLSLHILDLIENSIRAGASRIDVTVAQDFAHDILEIVVEDNGPGLPVPAGAATDPFYTTKRGKRTGLGLSLLGAAAEQAGGKLVILRSALGGVAVRATMWLTHIDRSPLGDLAATLSSAACTNPQLDLCCTVRVGERERVVRTSEVVKELPDSDRWGLAVARKVYEKITAGLTELEVMA
jgi:hypothetical protein